MTPPTRPPTVVRLDEILTVDPSGDGVHWSLQPGRDLNVNLVHLDPGSEVAAHTNEDVDVTLIVLTGTGRLRIDDANHELSPHVLALAAVGTERSIIAGPDGLTYLTVHRSRGPLDIAPVRGLRG